MSDLTDLILSVDKKQSDEATAQRCPEHGNRLTCDRSGAAIVCGKYFGPQRLCGYTVPVSI